MSLIQDIIQEPLYFAKRNGIYALGKYVAHSVAEITPNMVMQLGAISAGWGHTMIGLTTVGLTAGVSAGLVQVDYYHKRDNLKDFYKEELAAKLKKPQKQLTTADLDLIAKGDPVSNGNGVITEELNRSKKQRNFGVVFSFLATMSALAVVFFALPAVGIAPSPSLFHLLSATAKEWGALAVNAGVGLATYNAVKIPLHWIGDKLFGLDKETTHDRIVALHRDHEAGKGVSREQVLSIFVSAHPELDKMIAGKFGLPYEELVFADKHRAATEIGKLIPLEHLTAEINAGKINVSELAFAVEGQISGVRRESAPIKKRGAIHHLLSKVSDVASRLTHPKAEYEGMKLHLSDMASAIPYESEGVPDPKFVERLGRVKFDTSKGIAQQILDQQSNAPSTQTLQ